VKLRVVYLNGQNAASGFTENDLSFIFLNENHNSIIRANLERESRRRCYAGMARSTIDLSSGAVEIYKGTGPFGKSRPVGVTSYGFFIVVRLFYVTLRCQDVPKRCVINLAASNRSNVDPVICVSQDLSLFVRLSLIYRSVPGHHV
jgi:hypothetical protein